MGLIGDKRHNGFAQVLKVLICNKNNKIAAQYGDNYNCRLNADIKLFGTAKGFVLSFDAIVAAFLLIIAFAAVLSINRPAMFQVSEYKQMHYSSDDAMQMLSNSKFSGLNESIRQELLNSTNLTSEDLDKSLIDIVALLWSFNQTDYAANLTKTFFGSFIPEGMQYALIVKESGAERVIYNTSNYSQAHSKKMASSSRIVSGYKENTPVKGYISRASISKISKITSSQVYFGGFIGQGNITVSSLLPDNTVNITRLYLELNAGNNFTLSANGFRIKNYTVSGSNNISANTKDTLADADVLSHFVPGSNNITIEFTGGNLSEHYIGGGYLSITYMTNETNTLEPLDRYEFPAISGLINVYSSFYVPGTLKNLTVHLKFKNNYTTFLKIGSAEVFNSTGSGSVEEITLTDKNLIALNYINLSEKTVPIRLGVKNISSSIGEAGNADVILITDLSGSMEWQLNSTNNGNSILDCASIYLYNYTTSRISLAKCIDKEFTDTVLNTSGNRVGLVGFNDDAYSYQNLTSNASLLKSKIDDYPDTPSGGTCICCAINRAYAMLDSISNSTREKYVLVMTDGIAGYDCGISPSGMGSGWKMLRQMPCGNGCDPQTSTCTPPSNWTKLSFDDSLWNTTTLPRSYTESGAVRYYRKVITINRTDLTGDQIFYMRHRRGGECYINEHLIGNDSSCADPGGTWNWDNAWRVPISYLNTSGQNIIACRVRAGTTYQGTRFNAELRLKDVGTIFSGSTGCGGNSWECDSSACDGASYDSSHLASRAFGDLNATVYSVGFGPVASCSIGNTTLQNIAIEGNGSYYTSDNAYELESIYASIAGKILNASYFAQSISIFGDLQESALYLGSYIGFNYTSNTAPLSYKDISVTVETQAFGGNVSSPKNMSFNISSGVEVLNAKVTSYSSQYWTDRLFVNNGSSWQKVYWLGDYGSDYTQLGDPFIINVPQKDLKAGSTNTVSIDTATNETSTYGGSPDNRIIYIVKLNNSLGYGNVFETFDAARNDSLNRLKTYLLAYNITVNDADISTASVGDIPWMWGPAIITLKVWK